MLRIHLTRPRATHDCLSKQNRWHDTSRGWLVPAQRSDPFRNPTSVWWRESPASLIGLSSRSHRSKISYTEWIRRRPRGSATADDHSRVDGVHRRRGSTSSSAMECISTLRAIQHFLTGSQNRLLLDHRFCDALVASFLDPKTASLMASRRR